MTAVDPAGRSVAYARACADAAASAGVTVRTLDSLEDLARVDALFAAIWGSTGQQVAMPVNLLRALTHSGSYVAGAWRGEQLVGAAVAFLCSTQAAYISGTVIPVDGGLLRGVW